MKLISIILLSLLSFNASSQAIYKGFAAKKYVVPNIAPVSNAGTDKSITLPTNSTTLPGSGTDADGTISAYSWVKISGPVTGTITNASSAVTALASLTAGTYIFTLTVTDNSGGTASDNVTVTVSPAANISPVANAGTDQAITLPVNNTTLSGSGSDADGTISNYAWVKLSGPASYIIVNSSSATTAINSLTAGVYQFQLTVTDNNGATNADVVQVTVNAAPPANIPPVANAGTNQTITLPTTTATLTGSGSDADGTVTGYAWTKLSGPTGGTITSPTSTSTGITSLQAGIYQFQLTVTDNLGATGSNTTTVTVNSAANIAPIANAGPDKSRTLPSDTATLFGTGTDADGTIVSYAWTKLVGSPSGGVIVNPSSATTFITGLIQGTYQYQFAVTDNSGAVNIDYVLINVAANPSPGTANGAFSFTLASSANTSAGVFKNDSILVRTLWSNERYAAGSYTKKWNGTDDYGNMITSPDATYKVKVLSNNVQYNWLGGSIGNTSDSATGTNRHKGLYHCMRGLAFVGSFGYFCTGYGEGQPSVGKFNIATPNQKIFIYPLTQSTGDINYLATDGTNVYWSVLDAYSTNNTMVFGTKVSDDTEVLFSAGSSYTLSDGKIYANAIGISNSNNSAITGLAVQKTGSYLFVARKNLNQLQVLDKTTGALAQTLTYTSPKGLSVDGSNNLWMVTGTNTVAKYTVNANGTLTAAILTLSGLVNPISTQVNTAGTEVNITDGGTSQQIKIFNNSTGSLLNTIGTANGYNADANVSNSKFYFSNIDNNTEGGNGVLPFIAFQSDGSYWVNDAGNFRVQHYSSSNTFVNRIMSLGSTYSVYTDRNNPTRVISEMLEFEIDYTAPSTATNWVLKRNYGGVISRIIYDGPPNTIMTLSNGRTYGLIRKRNPSDAFEIVEFVTTGIIRLSGVSITGFGNNFASDGAIQVFTEAGVNSTLKRYPLTGFDGANNPLWSSTGELLLASPATDTTIGNAFTYPTLAYGSTNKIAVFNGSSYRYDNNSDKRFHKGYHLAIASKGATNSFLAQTEKSNHRSYEGNYPDAAWFEVGNDVNGYAGGIVNIVDRNIITSYHGEFWKGSQTNKFNHYWDNGLAIGQFGTTGRENYIAEGMMAGNVLTPTVIKVGGDSLFIVHGDESATAGNHMWKITNLNSISEQVITMPFPSAYTPEVLNYTDLLTGLPFDSKIIGTTAGWTRSPVLDSSKWTTRTSAITYDYLKSPDIYTRFDYQTATTNTVSRNLGVNNVTSNWILTGEIFNGYSAGYNSSPAFAYIKVLDDVGKELARFYAEKLDAGYPNYTSNIKFNTTTLFTKTQAFSKSVDSIFFKSQPFNLTINNGSVTFQYAGLSTVTTTIFDATANWHKPTTLQIAFIHNGNSGLAYSREIALRYLKFYKDSF